MIFYPKVTWSGGSRTLLFGTPVDDAMGGPYMEQDVVRVPGTGEQDSWTHGIFPRAKFAFRWVPASGVTENAGWHFPAPGVAAWLQHQRQHKDTFTFYVDKNSGGAHTCRLVSAQETREKAQPVLYRIDVEIEDVNGVEFVEF